MDVLPLVAVFAVAVLALLSVRIVPRAHARNVERLGRYIRTLGAGVGLVAPIVDRVGPAIDLRAQQLAVAPQPVVTADSQIVQVATRIDLRVVDPRAAGYEVADYRQAVETLMTTVLRNVAGSIDRADVSTSRSWLELTLLEAVRDSARHWGIEVDRVVVEFARPAAG
jgi:regulator of protease activity HflC (stomatin/prohibitin superfamily)